MLLCYVLLVPLVLPFYLMFNTTMIFDVFSFFLVVILTYFVAVVMLFFFWCANANDVDECFPVGNVLLYKMKIRNK